MSELSRGFGYLPTSKICLASHSADRQIYGKGVPFFYACSETSHFNKYEKEGKRMEWGRIFDVTALFFDDIIGTPKGGTAHVTRAIPPNLKLLPYNWKSLILRGIFIQPYSLFNTAQFLSISGDNSSIAFSRFLSALISVLTCAIIAASFSSHSLRVLA